jgi:hypothetical protein
MNDSRRKRLLRKAEEAEKNAREYEAHMGALVWVPPLWPLLLLFLGLSEMERKRAERLRKKANK